jgi:hypothetical protein
MAILSKELANWIAVGRTPRSLPRLFAAECQDVGQTRKHELRAPSAEHCRGILECATTRHRQQCRASALDCVANADRRGLPSAPAGMLVVAKDAMRIAAHVAGALLLWATGGLACEARTEGPAEARTDDRGREPVGPRCAWVPEPPELTLPRSEVSGMLQGTSRNRSTTCTREKGAGGPESVYLLRLRERAVVDLEAISNIDTVIAVRKVCDDPLTELACNDDSGGRAPRLSTTSPLVSANSPPPPAPPIPSPPPAASDASAAALASVVIPHALDAHLRVVLAPGTYYVLVDAANRLGVGAEYLLKVITSPPPPQSSCGTALPIEDGDSLPVEEIAFGTELAPSCTGAQRQPALYYRATIPSGQRLTVRARPIDGDPSFSPVLQLFSGCTETMCLSTDQAGMVADQRVLRHINNGPTELPVLLSVGASPVVSGATVQLEVNIGEVVRNGTCATSRPLADGQVLRGQDLTEGQVSLGDPCKQPGPSLFYQATLLPRQTLRLTATRPTYQPLIFFTPRLSCNEAVCRGAGGPMGQRLEYTNDDVVSQTLFIEASGLTGHPIELFDLNVSMPLPPAAVSATATRGSRP